MVDIGGRASDSRIGGNSYGEKMRRPCSRLDKYLCKLYSYKSNLRKYEYAMMQSLTHLAMAKKY
jgi:hypothetical protein